MISLVYLVRPNDVPAEKEWLRELKIYPSTEDYYDWIENKQYVRFGMIVSPETAVSIKLRHPLQLQANYRQR
jgi:hypothetical protein